MVGYKHPCRYCNEFIPPDSNYCPVCNKVNPLGQLRCPKCKSPVRKSWSSCSHCGLSLSITCPNCGGNTFFGDYCGNCEERLLVTCPNSKCNTVQPPISKVCIKCGQPL